MKISLLGTGIVGRTLGTKLVSLGHDVVMGSRDANNEKAIEWVSSVDNKASAATFADSAKHGELIINATSGAGSIAALQSAGAENLNGKTIIDVSNPLTFESGTPALFVSNDDSLGEQIQRTFPNANVVKTLNTMNCYLMVDPARIPGSHNAFVNGNDDNAKQQTKELLQEFGWPAESIIDLGDITASRAAESALHLWLRLMNTFGTANFNISVVRP